MHKRRRDSDDHNAEKSFAATLHSQIDILLGTEKIAFASLSASMANDAWDAAFESLRTELHAYYTSAANVYYEWCDGGAREYCRFILLQCARHYPFLVKFHEPPVIDAHAKATAFLEDFSRIHQRCATFYQAIPISHARGEFISWLRTNVPEVSAPEDVLRHYLWSLNGLYEPVHVIPQGGETYGAETALFAPICRLNAVVQIEEHFFAPFSKDFINERRYAREAVCRGKAVLRYCSATLLPPEEDSGAVHLADHLRRIQDGQQLNWHTRPVGRPQHPLKGKDRASITPGTFLSGAAEMTATLRQSHTRFLRTKRKGFSVLEEGDTNFWQVAWKHVEQLLEEHAQHTAKVVWRFWDGETERLYYEALLTHVAEHCPTWIRLHAPDRGLTTQIQEWGKWQKGMISLWEQWRKASTVLPFAYWARKEFSETGPEEIAYCLLWDTNHFLAVEPFHLIPQFRVDHDLSGAWDKENGKDFWVDHLFIAPVSGLEVVVEGDGEKFHKGQDQIVLDHARDIRLYSCGYRVLRYAFKEVQEINQAASGRVLWEDLAKVQYATHLAVPSR